MKQSEFLYYLVKSLNRSEKRYLRLTSSLQSGDKSYMKLFDLLEKKKSYDEVELIKKLEDTGVNKRNFPVAKKYLNDLILKILRSFHNKISINNEIYTSLKNIEILFQKGLVNQSYKVLGKTQPRLLVVRHRGFFTAPSWLPLPIWSSQLK